MPSSAHRQARVIVGRALVGVLLRVEAVAGVLPRRQHGARRGRALGVDDPAAHHQRLADLALPQVAAVGELGRALDMERPQHRRRRAGGRGVHHVDQRGDAQQVGEQDVFVALVVGELHRPGQRIDRGAPFRLGHLVLAHEAVQMAGEAHQQLARPRRGRVLGVFGEGVGDGVGRQVAHQRLALRRAS